jgi:hypothetical protein
MRCFNSFNDIVFGLEPALFMMHYIDCAIVRHFTYRLWGTKGMHMQQ